MAPLATAATATAGDYYQGGSGFDSSTAAAPEVRRPCNPTNAPGTVPSSNPMPRAPPAASPTNGFTPSSISPSSASERPSAASSTVR
eukprot:CAMPEP_0194744100 /NCGR_PEP_ID=MMETSP0296-20130528/100678_1 /TAXON_ID=39354 /ORGANISM="Heterosigma akashiwo, Strain CCMP2393" /LENGTH=86 /DNA_ID=CAMNT_0039656201 /DNA_START=407 /DNA_END=667 /DNA_ORIENTATION=+